ncbi:hypothetical protein DFA_01170 [Cavenderia fasciculata]|uniref:Generative cell specific-1/HAP2 domain-containing protein n=1 Tax=Cavenderia fasciculata TaxID=261658 RepID=F4PR89_CACFS|nr:uncharacterized protein DFA_01170 [Cavenderia fasciculata]EGG21289.1 hypothetical protein DFA_01170 [Cavenderia fasciculata]|eukprot:XP_004359139.1 hypothetical protein DFA_01170 [Cavenderia fasciculata]
MMMVVIIIFTFFIILHNNIVEPTFIGSSTIKKCIRDGTTTETSANLDCSEKLFVSLTLNNNQLETEQIQAVVYEDGTSGNLSYPIEVSFSKSQVFIQHPVIYETTVSNKPYETVIYKRDDIILTECEDKPTQSTCGYAVVNGSAVRDSQGFCCTCIFSDYFTQDHNSRANLKCTLLNDQSSSAHCLGFDKVLYNVYAIQPGTILYQINATIKYLDPEFNFTRSIPLVVSPVSPTAVDAKKNMILISDPTNPRTKMSPIQSSLILDRRLFGDECDKIGVSYSKFQNQPNRCGAQFGTCLNNQIDDYFKEDTDKMSKGLKGNYILSNFGSQMFASLDSSSSQANRFIKIQIDQIHQTQISLELKADQLRVIMNTSPGKIIEAYVKTFEAMSNNGVLVASIKNTGVIVAEYDVQVKNCSQEINPIPAQRSSIAGGQYKTLQFDITTQSELKDTYYCYVDLLNGNAELLDSKLVYFNVSETVIKNPQGTGTRDGDNLNIGFELTCDDYCPDFFQLLCFVSQPKCTSRLIITIAVLILVVIIVIAFIKSPALRKMFCCCCGCIGGKKGGSSSKESKQLSKYLESQKEQEIQSLINSTQQQSQLNQQNQQNQQNINTDNNNNNNDNNNSLDNAIKNGIKLFLNLELSNDTFNDFGLLSESDNDKHFICFSGSIVKKNSSYTFTPNPMTQTLFQNQDNRKQFLNPPEPLRKELLSTNLTKSQAIKMVTANAPKPNYIWINKVKPSTINNNKHQQLK